MEVSRMREHADRRVQEELKMEQRKRNLMVLIMHHLQGHGYADTVTRLQTECNLSLKKVTAADNMDLITILQEYETYFGIKFGKVPKLVKKLTSEDASDVPPSSLRKKSTPTPAKFSSEELPSYDTESRQYAPSLPKLKQGDKPRKKKSDSKESLPTPTPPTNVPITSIKAHTEILDSFGIIGTKPTQNTFSKTDSLPAAAEPSSTQLSASIGNPLYETKLLKPPPHYESLELRELAAIITRDIYMENPNVHWKDIAGLATSKRLVRESVVYPMRFPELFTGILSPWKGLLLYGPPGTGKTLLAKAVATECKTTFFNISASSIVSKWRGDSEKLVRVLFELARYHAPSTIFIDEIEAIMGHRTGGENGGSEHEGSRRMKTELLVQMDGLANGTHGGGANACVFLLAASNLPWDLDVAMLRRLEKRILIDLPDEEARASVFEMKLPQGSVDGSGNLLVADLNYQQLARQSQGYSGSDIQLVCKEAAMRPLRRLFDMIEMHDSQEGETEPFTFSRQPVTMSDVLEALKTTRPSTNPTQTARYKEWQSDFGSV